MCDLGVVRFLVFTSVFFTGGAFPYSVFGESLQPGLTLYPGSELVDESADRERGSHQVVLGKLRKVNNVLLPESAETVQGVKSTRTYYLPEARRTEDVGEHFSRQLDGLGEIVFVCKGRTCGSSSYWANKVFQHSILYGPEQHQQYYVARLDGGASYLVVYVGQRATRKIYAHLERVAVVREDFRIDEVVAALESRGRFVFDLSESGAYTPALIQAAREVAVSYDKPLILVAHDRLKAGESLTAAVKRTREDAEKLVAAIRAGDESAELDVVAHGVGALAPSELHSATRIEMIVIQTITP
jgi:hypothetical protein